MKRLVLGLVIVSSLLLSDSFDDKMLKRGNEISKIPQVFAGKEFEETWMFNVLAENCPKSIGEKRTKCILMNRKDVLQRWKDIDKKLLRIAKENNDNIVWIAQQIYNVDAISEAKIEGKNTYSNGGDKKQKGARLPTLKEITKACYDKNLRKYFYNATTGYGDDSFDTYFTYKNNNSEYIDFKNCKTTSLFRTERYATKYVKNLK